MYVLLSLAIIGLLLVSNELLWRKKEAHTEHQRKIIHIIVGTFVAFFPLYMSWNDIRLISLAFLLVVILSKTFNIFGSIHRVERFSLGEICFALAIGVLTFISTSDWIYIASILQMSLADGLAAIAGVNLGKNNSYKIFGATKSIAGSLTCFVVSLVILIIASAAAQIHISFGVLLFASVIATAVENIAIYGLDNIFLPLAVAFILTRV